MRLLGIPLDIFSLHRLRGEDGGCEHYLLLKVARPAFNNADERDYARAVEAADTTSRALIELYQSEALPRECAGRHAANLVGELQAYPAGGEAFEEGGGFHVDVWVAETRFGHPWVAMGAAEGEEEFWRAVERDENLSGLGARRPAKRLRAYFLTGGEDASREG